ncbi:type II and III secretion system protein family protein [Consotaella aegiceratis]|uniref:type II and III secretion system protein family protein n=1 Tax=Consotaella aegiceratis TaxID=3097961 RepID=UPI002F40459A
MALLAGLIILPSAPLQAQAQERLVRIGNGVVTKIVVRPGSTFTITTTQPFANLVVGNMDVADVVPLSERSFYIQGKTTGVTNISIFNDGDGLLGVLDTTVSIDFSEVQAAIRAAVPGSHVTVTNFNNRIHLSGTVDSAPDVTRAVEIAQQFSTDPVINALAVTDAQQVSLEVRVLEARRSAGRDLGVNLRVRGGTSLGVTGSRMRLNAAESPEAAAGYDNYQGVISQIDTDTGRNSQGTPFGSMIAQVLESAGVKVDMIINALEAKGLVRRLAQPNLATVSGEKASFHAGGEVPIQTVVSNGNTTATQTDYRPYGVRLEFQPTVLDHGLINLRIMTEVSEIDDAVNVDGNPGFTSRKAQTVLELRDGQSFALAGLLQTVNSRTVEQLPWIGQLPILGTLFRSTSFQKEESDLVVVVTPRIVRPARPDERLRSPLDGTSPANDFELFALGLLEVDKDMLRSFRDGTGIVGPYGHIIDWKEADDHGTVQP